VLGRRRQVEDFREFSRELLLRFDRRTAAIEAELRIQREENRRYFAALDAKLEESLEHSRELRAECRAQSEALMHVLAQLRGGGAAPAT
jgi:hypothetical protein